MEGIRFGRHLIEWRSACVDETGRGQEEVLGTLRR